MEAERSLLSVKVLRRNTAELEDRPIVDSASLAAIRISFDSSSSIAARFPNRSRTYLRVTCGLYSADSSTQRTCSNASSCHPAPSNKAITNTTIVINTTEGEMRRTGLGGSKSDCGGSYGFMLTVCHHLEAPSILSPCPLRFHCGRQRGFEPIIRRLIPWPSCSELLPLPPSHHGMRSSSCCLDSRILAASFAASICMFRLKSGPGGKYCTSSREFFQGPGNCCCPTDPWLFQTATNANSRAENAARTGSRRLIISLNPHSVLSPANEQRTAPPFVAAFPSAVSMCMSTSE